MYLLYGSDKAVWRLRDGSTSVWFHRIRRPPLSGLAGRSGSKVPIDLRQRAARQGTPRESSQPLRHDHLLDDLGFVVHDEVGIALDHSERLVSKDICYFEQ